MTQTRTKFQTKPMISGEISVPEFKCGIQDLDRFLLNIQLMLINAESNPQRLELVNDQLVLFGRGYTIDGPSGELTTLAKRHLNLWRVALQQRGNEHG